MNKRVVVGVWQSRADWEAWHEDVAFVATRNRLDILQADAGETVWYEVVVDHSARPLRWLAVQAVGTVRKRAKTLSGRATANQ
jgi:hypothetical protein